MSRLEGSYSIIIPAQNAVLSAHTYTEIYGGSAGCSVVINGHTVNIGAGSRVPIKISSVSGGTGCYLLGETTSSFIHNPIL